MVTGDNLITAKAIAKECGILSEELLLKPDSVMEGPEFYRRMGGLICRNCKVMSPCECSKKDVKEGVLNLEAFKAIHRNLRVLARSRPEDKYLLVTGLREMGDVVAVTGDGTNDAPALAQADVAVAMNSGTQAAKEAGNLVDLDSNPTKLIEVVEVGKQLLMTRGSLTTFSIANDVAKYFAILPAAFAGTYPQLDALNIMALATPDSAILSAVIFNALIIIFLIPLALRGVTYKRVSAVRLLRNNVFIYGLGGLIVPFVGIKFIDMILGAMGVV